MTEQKEVLFNLCVQRRVAEIMRQPWLKSMQKPKMRTMVLSSIERGQSLNKKQRDWLIEVLTTGKFPDDERNNRFGEQVLYYQQINAALYEDPETGEPVNEKAFHRYKNPSKEGEKKLCAVDIVHEALAQCGFHITPASLNNAYSAFKKKLGET